MPEDTGSKQANSGQFKPGQSGNPAGRPAGSRSHATILAEKLMSEDIEDVVNAVVKAAKDGDMTACRLILERLVPARKDGPVNLTMPEMKTADDAAKALAASIESVARGELTPAEATAVSGLIENFRKALETSELEARITKLENHHG